VFWFHINSKTLNTKIGLKETTTFSIVLYECEPWSLTLGEHILEAYKNKSVTNIRRCKRHEASEAYRKLNRD